MAGLYEEQILGAKNRAETARRLRDQLAVSGGPQGVMAGHYYVAPHWTQHLAHFLRQNQLSSDEQEALQEAAKLQRQQAQQRIDYLTQMGISVPQALAEKAQTPAEQPSMFEKIGSVFTGEELPSRQPTPYQSRAQKAATPELQESATLQLAATDPEFLRGITEYQKAKSDLDTKSYARALRGVPQGFDVNENGELVPMPVAGGGNFLNTVLPLQAQARGGYVNPIQQHQMSVSDAQLQLQMRQEQRALEEHQAKMAKEAREAAKETPTEVKEQQKIADAQEALNILQEAAPLVTQATGSGLGAARDVAMRFFGKSTPQSQAASSLSSLGGSLVAKMPKMSGPQSDKDVLLYKEMAGRIGDPTVPTEDKIAAMNTINTLQSKYAGVKPAKLPFGGAQPKPADTSVDDLVKKYGGQ